MTEKIIDVVPIFGPVNEDGSRAVLGVDIVVLVVDAETHRIPFMTYGAIEPGSAEWDEFVEDAKRKAPFQAWKQYGEPKKLI